MRDTPVAADPTTRARGADDFRIAVAGPALTEPLAQFLDCGAEGLPIGQGGTSVWQLVSGLIDHHRHVSVVTLDAAVRSPILANGPLLDVIYGPFRPRHRMRDLMAAERRAVRDGLLRLRPDLVHAHWCYEYAMGALATGLPTLVTVHDWAPTVVRLMDARYRPYWTGRAVMFFITLARARYVTAISPYIAERIRTFTRAAIEVVPNGFPDECFAKGANDQKPQGARPLGPPILLSVNNGFGPLKNVTRLLEAFRLVTQRGVDCELQLIGVDYEAGGPCDLWARQRGLVEKVMFLGPLGRDDVLRQMRSATVLTHASREESFGMVLIESMAQGTAVMGGKRSGAIPWVLDSGKAGLLVDVEDPRALADGIAAMLTNPSLRLQLADAGYKRAWEYFRQSQVTERYLDAYRRVLDEE